MIILDTNLISELMRQGPEPSVSDWVAAQPVDKLFITAINEAEIFYGINLLPVGERRDRLHNAAAQMFSVDFMGKILPFDDKAAIFFAIIAARRRQIGRPISHPDAQIAAIARVHDAILATRNENDFIDCGIEVINPWKY